MTGLKTLFVRVDRLGDLLVTLPVDELVNDRAVHWCIPKGLGFLLESREPVRDYREQSRAFSKENFISFFRFLKEEKFSEAIVFHAPWWVGFALWLARVPVRVGVLSQWHSFLFFNRGVRQKRSQAVCHELQYNIQLLGRGLQIKVNTPSLLYSRLTTSGNASALKPKSYFVVHPGMAGSARNWSVEKYEALIRELITTNEVAITGTSIDKIWLDPLKIAFQNEKRVHWFDDKLNGKQWIDLLGNSLGVVAPSTGAVHVAASLAVPTVGIYSPVKVQKAVRWGPLGPKVKVQEPQVDCPGHHHCLMEKCPHFDCMNTINPSAVAQTLKLTLSEN